MQLDKDLLLVGLGNPGTQYAQTRHNIGFRFIDAVARKLELNFKDKNSYQICVHTENRKKIYLMKPMMYMNLSGIPVLHLASFYKVEPENIAVVYDDIALPFGKIRVRDKGSSGGHNGIKSIIENLGKENFIRIRLGIGENRNIPLEKYVLERFNKEQEAVLPDLFKTAEDALWSVFHFGPESAMNRFNGD